VRHATPDGDTERLHAVATDQPGLVLRRPLQKLRQVAIVYALLPLVAAGLGAWIATQIAYARSEAHTDRRIAALEDDLAERRRVRAEQDAARDAQSREVYALLCLLLDHAQPRDAAVEAKRAKYGCAGGVPSPGPQSPPPAAPSSAVPVPGGSRTTAALVVPPPRRSRSTGLPVPSPAGPPPASPVPPPGGPLLCVEVSPLLRLCV
jgi:hypothetical protein